MSSSDLLKIKKTVDNLHTEKQKIEKEKNKKGGKGKTKAKLRMEGDGVSNKNQFGEPFNDSDINQNFFTSLSKG